MNMSNQHKVALVTGSSRGIGRETARVLANAGYQIVLHGKNPDTLEKTRLQFESDGINAESYAADITDIEEVQSMITWIKDNLGRLDVLVTNASLTMEAEFEETDSEAFRQVVDSHIYGSIFPVKAALSEIKANKGSIILISSLAGLHGLPRFSAYCTGKMALTAFWQSLRFEQRNTGIHLGLVHLAFVKNDDKKTLITAKGELENMPPRPTGMQQSQEAVAKGIYRVIKRRKARTVLSVYGKTFALSARFIPNILYLFILKFFKA